ncbi:hypothetical protein [Lachnospira multipara]|uniref:hypothetical protein n=1 Tax=Lachnospira multipara TaxID=28051 RepID=UPI0004884317|nr:hypothetical protein [Lachnospira multipara]
MKRKMIKIVASIVVTGIILFPLAVFAENVENGELIFTGGQNSQVVYSDIRDAKPDNDFNYKVLAIVKVGGSKYTSGWKDDQAYVEHRRHWYTNETAHYDCYLR